MELFILVLQVGLAAVLAVAAIGKVRDLPGSRQAVNDFGVPKNLADPLGTALPFVEMILAVGLLFGATATVAAVGALLLFLAFIAGIGWNLRQGKHPDCHCFGEFHSSPASWRTIARNAVFVAMAAVIVAAGGNGIVETYDDLSTAGQVGLWITLLVGAIGAAQWWYLDHIWKHQQQVTAELEALRTEMVFVRYETAAAEPASVHTSPIVAEPVGEPAPTLDLPALMGGRLTLDDLLAEGKPILLLFTSPDCGFCVAMYPEVREWSRRFGNDLTVAVVGRGEVEANLEKLAEYDFPYVAIDEDMSVATAYDAVPTPSGVIVWSNGTLMEDGVATGRAEIQKLVGRVLQRRQSRISPAPVADHDPAVAAPETTPSGPMVESWPAMAFDLPAPEGGRVTLDGLLERGKPVLAVFWSPTCGYCTQLGPEAGEWVRRFSDEVTFTFISNGGEEANLAEIEKFGLINVGLQDVNEVMQAMGGNGTPSAVLIRPDGFIQDDPATGAYAIRRLLGRAINSGDAPPRVVPARPSATGNGTQDGTGNGHQDDQDDEIRAYLQRSAESNVPEQGTAGSRLPWPDLDGSYVGLDDYRGDDLVLVFWGVDCAFSQRMLLDLKEWELGAGSTTRRVLIVSSGDVEANRAQGLRSRIVIDNNFAAGTSYGATGTPAAIRLDAQGRVSSGLAEGADAVIDLLYDFSESRAELQAR